MQLTRDFYTLAPQKIDAFLVSSPILVILEAHLKIAKLLVVTGYAKEMISREARED